MTPHPQPSLPRQALCLLVAAATLAAPAAAPYLDAAEPGHEVRVGGTGSEGVHHVHHDHLLCLQLRDAPSDLDAAVPALPCPDRPAARAAARPDRPLLTHPQRRLAPARAPPRG